MTAVPATGAADSSRGRVGRALAGAAVGAFGTLFLVGLVLWSRDSALTATLWLLPDTWSEGGIRRVTAGLGIPVGAVSAFVMLLELLAATAGLVTATLVLRGATTWFRLYVAVVIALWVTMGGAMPALYENALDGRSADIPMLLQGVGWVAVFPIAYLFPDGRFVPRWSRWTAIGWAAYLPTLAVLGLIGYQSDPDSLVETLPLFVLFGTCAYAAVHRYRTVSTPDERRQTRGVVAALSLWFALVLVVTVTPLRSLLDQVSGPGLAANAVVLLCTYLVAVLLPAAIAVAVLRHRLYEVDVWVNRALVYGVLTAAVVALYALFAGLAGLVWRESDLTAPLAATVVVAVAFHPVRLRAQRWVDRFVYGRRREPYAVLTDLGRRLDTVVTADEVLRTLVRQVGTTLKLGFAEATHGDVGVTWPDSAVGRPARAETFHLRWQDQNLGALVVAPRRGDELSTEDRDLIDGLARQAGAAVQAAVLNADLRRSRERILVAREDERRRLQRDFHDGLGPTLASLYQRVDAARSMIGHDPRTAEALLADVSEQTRSVIGEIRSLVRALRPPELDELGVAGAIEAVGGRLDGLGVHVVTNGLPRLEPVVESAVYRIAVEALTNAARHAQATAATVHLGVVDGVLTLDVLDDGSGIAAGSPRGTGLRSMRERADELGGSCEVSAPPGGGTRVRAVLPLRGPT